MFRDAWVVVIALGGLSACTSGQVMCLRAEDCGGQGVCLPSGQCASECTADTQCGPGEKCSAAGGCVPRTQCGIDEDCISSQVCSRTKSVCIARCTATSCTSGLQCQADGHCAAVYPPSASKDAGPTSCGGEVLPAQRIQPNVHVVLDGSESMMDCIKTGGDGIPLPGLCDSDSDPWLYSLSPSTSKWASAQTAIREITTNHQADIRFGMSVFPSWIYGMPPNTKDGNALHSWWVQEWFKKGEQLDCTGGVLKVSPGENKAAPIIGAFTEWAPGAGTPIAAALNEAAKVPELADTSRDNFVLLVTDGMENCGGNPVGAVQSLRARGVKTVVVGFGSEVDPSMLTQMAVAGGMENGTSLKYYQADDSATLIYSMKSIARGLLSCEFQMSKSNLDVSLLDVYLDAQRIARDTSHTKGWDVDVSTRRVTLYGDACTSLRQAKEPKLSLSYGCPDDGFDEGPGGGNGNTDGGGEGSGGGGGGGIN